MKLEDIIYEMRTIWLTVTMISVGVIIGIGFLPETIETGKWFLLFGFIMCWLWMGFTLRIYECELIENDDNIKSTGREIFKSEYYEGKGDNKVVLQFKNNADYNSFLNWWVLGNKPEDMDNKID